jgi:serine/threonine protein kinase
LDGLLEDKGEGGRVLYALGLGLKSVELIERLHSAGVIHNDFHAGNIAFKRLDKLLSDYDSLVDELILIDFGSSEFIAINHQCKSKDVGVDTLLDARLLSPWQLAGKRAGRRDDVYRVLEMIYRIFHELIQGLDIRDFWFTFKGASKIEFLENMRKAKLENFFKLSFIDWSQISPDGAQLQSELVALMDSVLKLNEVDSEPRYSDIKARLSVLLRNRTGGHAPPPRPPPPFSKPKSPRSPKQISPEEPSDITPKDPPIVWIIVAVVLGVVGVVSIGLIYLKCIRKP